MQRAVSESPVCCCPCRSYGLLHMSADWDTALLQASEMVGVCNVLQTVGDPLSLSLALDIMEEVLHAGDARKTGRRMARDGALAALVSNPQVRAERHASLYSECL